ncbi:MAG: hypothetical protein M1549_01865 [Candidatus Dependentiae bacterium]|nr:hypothetical protein [Candidatus Dependentiae bacterium]
MEQLKKPFFNLEQEVFAAVAAEKKNKGQLRALVAELKKIRGAKSPQTSYLVACDVLPNSFQQLIASHQYWAFSRLLGLEEKAVQLEKCASQKAFDKELLLKMEQEFEYEKEKKIFELSLDEVTGANSIFEQFILQGVGVLIEHLKGVILAMPQSEQSAKLPQLAGQDKKPPRKFIGNIHQRRGCGVCEQKGCAEQPIEASWFSSYSRGAHRSCHKLMQEVEKDLEKKIREAFAPDEWEQNITHVVAMKAVRKVCDCSLLQYVKEHSISALKKLVDTVGRDAAEAYIKEATKGLTVIG